MIIKEIVEAYQIDAIDFERFLIRQKLPHKSKFSGIVVEDDVIEEYIRAFRAEEEARASSKVRKEVTACKNETAKTDKGSTEAMRFCPYCGKIL